VNGRVFVNNASLGIYAKIVQSDDYRNAQVETVVRTLPDLLPPRAQPFDLNFRPPTGPQWRGAQLVLVSNNRYRPARPGTSGNRGGLNEGTLGVLAVRLAGAPDVLALIATETTGAPLQLPGWLDFSVPTFVVESAEPLEIALDGEAAIMEPPLEFESLPAALRVLVRS
jgi:diacylglycerol kinase family enzyme